MIHRLLLFFSLALLLGVSSVNAQPVINANEYWTNLLSLSYDYQTNGSVRYLVQDPSNPNNLCAIMMASPDNLATSRYTYFSYSTDGGNTWGPQQAVTTTTRHGFPCMTLSDGVPVIVDHGGSPTTALAYSDVIFGLTTFNPLGSIVMDGYIWPHTTGTANGNVVVVAAPNDGGPFRGNWCTYNTQSLSWSSWTATPSIGGPSGNFDISAGPNGEVYIIGTDYAGTEAMYVYKSTDNGLTFDAGTMIFDYLVDGSDTLYAFIDGGKSSVWTDDGEFHLTFMVYGNNVTAYGTNGFDAPGNRILHWNETSGLSYVAGYDNMPGLDTVVYTALMNPVCQPSIGKTANGTLVCAFTAFVNGNTQIVANGDTLTAGEIFYSYSADGGLNWADPINVTNTPGIEEKHPSVVESTNDNTVKMTYVRDKLAGGWVNVAAWGADSVWTIYYNGATVGINPNTGLVESYELLQNYPNPFNPSTTIKYHLAKAGFVSLKVYDITGREVKSLVNQRQEFGEYSVTFDAASLPSGVYYYTIKAGDFVSTKKMVLLK